MDLQLGVWRARRVLLACLSAGLGLAAALGLAGGLLPVQASAEPTAATEQRDLGQPNIVVVLIDDMGYGDTQAYNDQCPYPTPTLDGLAEAGMRFTDAHTPSAVCTPTRYGLLTGRYCWRTRLQRGVLLGLGEHLIDPERTTLADLAKSQGYATACVGKWHLGMDFARDGQDVDFTKPVANGPLVNGFDHFFGIPSSLDFAPYLYVEDDRVTAPVTNSVGDNPFPAMYRKGLVADGFDHSKVLDTFVDHAIGWVKDHAESNGEQPFFLYMPLASPHTPIYPAEAFMGKSHAGPYGDFVMNTDAAIGRLMQTLEAMGVAENTLVVVTSDNGSLMKTVPDKPDHTDDETVHRYRPETHLSNGIYKGTKADIYEGGHRVYFTVRWPGVVAPGSVSDQPVSLVDVFATVAEVFGVPSNNVSGEDSFSMLPVWLGEQETVDRGPIIMHSVDGMFAIRDGDWKLIAGNGSGGWLNPRGKAFARPYQLYNLKDDPTESKDVIEENPTIAQALEAKLEAIRQQGGSR